MHERDKLAEAEFFYAKLVRESYNITFKTDPTFESASEKAFRYYLNAFLSAGRGVLSRARTEAKGIPGGQGWYDNFKRGNKLLEYFTDKRDINVHIRSEPLAESILEVMYNSPPVTVVENGVTFERHFTPTMKTLNYFDDWPDTDIVTLGQAYLDELQRLVEDGVQRGFISG